MNGFRNSTKTVQGHHMPGSPEYRFAEGGLVPPGPRGMPRGYEMRPIVPRPRAMPDAKKLSMPKTRSDKMSVPHVKKARGGHIGHALSPPVPYSQDEAEYPRKAARPGYAKGGKLHLDIKKGALHERLGVSGPIPTGRIKKDLRKAKARGNTRDVRQDVLALNMRKWDKKAKGGVHKDAKQDQEMIGTAMKRHVQAPKPQGHGAKVRGALAFMREPLCGGGRP